MVQLIRPPEGAIRTNRIFHDHGAPTGSGQASRVARQDHQSVLASEVERTDQDDLRIDGDRLCDGHSELNLGLETARTGGFRE